MCLETIVGYSSDLHVYIIVAGLSHVNFFVTLASFEGPMLECRIHFEQVGKGQLKNTTKDITNCCFGS